jgi:hypothetical protein
MGNKGRRQNKNVEESLVKDQAETTSDVETIKDERRILQSTAEVDMKSIQDVEELAGESESTNKEKIYTEVIKEEEIKFKQESTDSQADTDVVTIQEKLVVEMDQTKELEEETRQNWTQGQRSWLEKANTFHLVL